jgi:TolB-like protein
VPLKPSTHLDPDVKAASLAVLPFANRGASADDEYFAEGVADELLNALAKIEGLQVCARASSFHFKHKLDDLAEVGRTLNVTTVLGGSVRRVGDHVHISVQLVSAADGRPLWSATYDRPLGDIFAIEDDLALSVVKALRETPSGNAAGADRSGPVKAEVANAFRGRGTNVEAHRLYLLARHLAERINREDTATAVEVLGQALALEPDHALAWALLGTAHYRQAGFGWAPLAEARERAREARERALAIAPDLVEGHLALAAARHYDDRDHEGAEALLRQVLDRAPGNATAPSRRRDRHARRPTGGGQRPLPSRAGTRPAERTHVPQPRVEPAQPRPPPRGGGGLPEGTGVRPAHGRLASAALDRPARPGAGR